MASLYHADFLAPVGMKDVYLHVPIFLEHQHFLNIAGGLLRYQFVGLPLGLPSAPWVFTKVLAPVLALLYSHKISTVGYLDNLLLRKQLMQALSDKVAWTV